MGNLKSSICANKMTPVAITASSILSLFCCYILLVTIPLFIPGGLIFSPILGVVCCVFFIILSVSAALGSRRICSESFTDVPVEEMTPMNPMYAPQSDNPFPPNSVMKEWNKAEYQPSDPSYYTSNIPANKDEFIYGSTFGI